MTLQEQVQSEIDRFGTVNFINYTGKYTRKGVTQAISKCGYTHEAMKHRGTAFGWRISGVKEETKDA